MISKLDHNLNKTGEQIRAVFQISYAVEAKLLKAKNFPPLRRKLNEFIESETVFYGYWIKEALKAVIEIRGGDDAIHIQSLVVDPANFRQGIATQLLQYILDTYQAKQYTVETGLANKPAKIFYEGFGFKKVKEWDTDHGVRKIAFELLK